MVAACRESFACAAAGRGCRYAAACARDMGGRARLCGIQRPADRQWNPKWNAARSGGHGSGERRRGGRLARVRPHLARHALLAYCANHAEQCQESEGGVDFPHRRHERAKRSGRDHKRSHAAEDRRFALYLFAAPDSLRARRADGQAQMEVRSEAEGRSVVPTRYLSRRFLRRPLDEQRRSTRPCVRAGE